MAKNPVAIFPAPCALAENVTAAYLDSQRVEYRPHSHRAVVQVDVNAPTYRALGAIAARQGLSISTFVNRLCEAAIEAAPGPAEVPFDG